MTDLRKFERWKKWLRRRWAGTLPVRVMLVPAARLPDDCGICEERLNAQGKRTGFIIHVADSLSVDSTFDTLIEEWAHYLRFQVPNPLDDEHDAIFGAIFNEIKRLGLLEQDYETCD